MRDKAILYVYISALLRVQKERQTYNKECADWPPKLPGKEGPATVHEGQLIL